MKFLKTLEGYVSTAEIESFGLEKKTGVYVVTVSTYGTEQDVEEFDTENDAWEYLDALIEKLED